jgi:hypothetical protein
MHERSYSFYSNNNDNYREEQYYQLPLVYFCVFFFKFYILIPDGHRFVLVIGIHELEGHLLLQPQSLIET